MRCLTQQVRQCFRTRADSFWNGSSSFKNVSQNVNFILLDKQYVFPKLHFFRILQQVKMCFSTSFKSWWLGRTSRKISVANEHVALYHKIVENSLSPCPPNSNRSCNIYKTIGLALSTMSPNSDQSCCKRFINRRFSLILQDIFEFGGMTTKNSQQSCDIRQWVQLLQLFFWKFSLMISSWMTWTNTSWLVVKPKKM